MIMTMPTTVSKMMKTRGMIIDVKFKRRGKKKLAESMVWRP